MNMKKNIFFVIVVVIIILVLVPLFATKKSDLNILDYYNAIPQRLLSKKKFKIVTKKDEHGKRTWGIRDPAYGNAFFPMVVDFKNGFIELEFSGAGYSRQQIVLFIAKSGKRYIGLSYYRHNGIFAEVSRLNFYRVDDNSWQEAPHLISLKLFHRKFLNNNAHLSKVESVKSIINPCPLFSFTLPRFGYTLEVEILASHLKLLVKHKSILRKINPKITNKDFKVLRDFIKMIRNEKVMFRWDKNKGIFVFAGMKKKQIIF